MTTRAHAFVPHQARGRRIELLHAGAVQNERLAAAKRFAGDRAVEGNEHLLVDQSFPLREIERQHAHLIRRGFEQREARVFMMNHAAKGRGDGVQQVVQVELETTALFTSSSTRRRSRSRASCRW